MVAKTKDPSKWSDITYIRCELDDALRKDLLIWLKKDHNWLAYIEAEADSGLRFGCHQDGRNNCMEARLTLLSNSIGVSTLVLQGRGPDLLKAIQALFFKHYVVLERNWENLDRPPEFKYETWG